MCTFRHNAPYPVVVVLVDVLVDVVVLVLVLVVLVLVLVLVVVLVLVLVDENTLPNQLLPLYLYHPLSVVSQYSSPITGLLGADAAVLILPLMSVICVSAIF